MEENPKAKRGYSRDSRPDCLQVVIAPVVTPNRFPLAYEVMDGNTSEHRTLKPFPERIKRATCAIPGATCTIWSVRRKGRIIKHEKKWLDLPWRQVRDSVSVKLFEEDGEIYVLARSDGRQAKENAMCRSLPGRDRLLLRIGAVKKGAGRAFGFFRIRIPEPGEAVTRKTFSFALDKPKLRHADSATVTICCSRV